MQFKLEKQAVKDLKFFKKNNVRLYKKCLQLVENIIESPENWIWKPEKLKYLSENFWSRRIDLEHRIVYQIDYKNDQILIFSCRFHYENV